MLADLLRDPAWGAVSALLALAVIVLTVVFFRVQRSQKRMLFHVVSNQRVLTVAPELSSRLQIQLDGQTLESVSLAVIRLGNTGNVPILPGDFHSPLRLVFSPPGEVLEVGAASDDTSIAFSAKIRGNEVEIEPLLMNPGDRITVRVLRAEEPGQVSVLARIVGVKAVGDVATEPATWSMRLAALGPVVALLVLPVVAVALFVGAWWATQYVLGDERAEAFGTNIVTPIIRTIIAGGFAWIVWVIVSSTLRELKNKRL